MCQISLLYIRFYGIYTVFFLIKKKLVFGRGLIWQFLWLAQPVSIHQIPTGKQVQLLRQVTCKYKERADPTMLIHPYLNKHK